jgi:hypothetical protein
MAAIVIGLPVAAVCLFILLPWIRDGHLPPGLLGIGLATLLIALLTTEGIGVPSVAEMFWLLLALGGEPWASARGFPRPAVQTRQARAWGTPLVAPRSVTIGWLVFTLGLTFACYSTSYSHVLPCQSAQWQANSDIINSRLSDARASLEKAVQADPRSFEAYSRLAQVDLEIWLKSLDPADYAAFEESDARARQLAPRSVAVWRASAARYQMAYSKTDSEHRRIEPAAIEQALASARRAVGLYPTSSFEHATMAMICQEAGDDAGYRHEACAALALDDIMVLANHPDKQLPPDLRQKMEAAAAEPSPRP